MSELIFRYSEALEQKNENTKTKLINWENFYLLIFLSYITCKLKKNK